MTTNKKLEELFDMAPSDSEESVMPEKEEPIDEKYISPATLVAFDKIEGALPAVRGLEASDKEMDELSNMAKDAFQNLMDLGFQVDSRFASEIFNSASSMLGHAITAKTAKTNKKLKMIQLQLAKADLDRKIEATKGTTTPIETPLGEGVVLDRNEIIKQVLAQHKSADK